MPRFFFDFLGGESVRDGVGCEFESLELAYLDAYRSMIQIGADLLLEQKDPSRQRIEITDGRGVVLMTLSFDEVFQSRGGRRLPDATFLEIRLAFESNRRLRGEIQEACAEARANVALARATLGRANASVRVGEDS